MKTLIKLAHAPLYLGPGGGWKNDAGEAVASHTAAEAVQKVNKLQLEQAEIFFFFDERSDADWNFSVPVSARVPGTIPQETAGACPLPSLPGPEQRD